MLDHGTVTANIPAADLARARAFYADKLGLSPYQEMEGAVLI
jgi:catechol 2,3-dioxygenase-like lactoylglutathione lyase family enzyme